MKLNHELVYWLEEYFNRLDYNRHQMEGVEQTCAYLHDMIDEEDEPGPTEEQLALLERSLEDEA